LAVDPLSAMQLAIRCAGDSLPPMRLAILNDLAGDGTFLPSTAGDVAKRIDKPRRSVDRQLQALHALGLATVKPQTSPWDYSLRVGIDPRVLDTKCCAEMLVDAHKHIEESERERQGCERPPTHISAQGETPAESFTRFGPSSNGHANQADDAANTAYINGLCRDCHERPPSAGRPRCDECHASYVRVMAGYDQ
jgi:hypothetical protein